jgi:head-tail adaptor
MTFLQPVLLWGLLGVLIPVIIHFWYQKRGKTIAWAATRWLSDKTSLQHRGLRLDEIPLLLLRCLLICMLIFILAKASTAWLDQQRSSVKIHFVERSQKVADTYRFEIEKAIQQSEAVYWIGDKMERVTDLSDVHAAAGGLQHLQNNIASVADGSAEIAIYIRNTNEITKGSKVVVPAPYKLFTASDSVRNQPANFLIGSSGKHVFIDQTSGLLKASENKRNLASEAVRSKPISILLDYQNETESKTVEAALSALSEIHSLSFNIHKTKNADAVYDWVFTNEKIDQPQKHTMYVVSGISYPGLIPDQVLLIQDSLTLSSSSMVRQGKLPEWLGEKMISYYGLKMNRNTLSEKQLQAMFTRAEQTQQNQSEQLGKSLLLGFILVLIAERWMSMRKNVSNNYA